jgi:hypothetical protein
MERSLFIPVREGLPEDPQLFGSKHETLGRRHESGCLIGIAAFRAS